MERADLLLKIIAAANGEPVTPVQLQKVAFLLSKEFADELPDDYYTFMKYDYGPFSAEIYKDAERLQIRGLVSIHVNPRGGWKEYAASYRGIIMELDAIPEEIVAYIEKKVEWARSQTFQQLVRYVYANYPEYRENSVFQG